MRKRSSWTASEPAASVAPARSESLIGPSIAVAIGRSARTGPDRRLVRNRDRPALPLDPYGRVASRLLPPGDRQGHRLARQHARDLAQAQLLRDRFLAAGQPGRRVKAVPERLDERRIGL